MDILLLLMTIHTIPIIATFDINMWRIEEPHNRKIRDSPISSRNSSTKSSVHSLKNTCKLWIRDPLSGGMDKVVDPTLNPIADCNRNFIPMTELKNGVLIIREEAQEKADECLGRCLNHKNQWENDVGPWMPIANQTFECDFVEANCTLNGAEVELYIHTQIWETKRSEAAATANKTDKPFQPDVYIIVIDSVSSTQARRAIPKTLNFIEKKMSGVNYHFLNKVGDNSYPNGFAFTMGWRTADSDRSRTGGSYLKATESSGAMCKKTKINDTVIYREFMKKGYKSLHAEDYLRGSLFSQPHCDGFKVQPSTHYYRPFLLEWNTPNVSSYMSLKNCLQNYSIMLDYTEKFINSYGDDPKIVFYWANYLAHNDGNMLYHIDDTLESFFRRSEAKMKNAFVFLMGDHGVRLGPTRNTKLGDYEVSNPFMVLTVPDRLRTNKQLMENMKINSEKLLTQFDTYATFVDILKFAPESNFQKWDHIPIIEPNPNNATSFLRPLGEYSDRNCNNIPTDSSFCLCQADSTVVSNPGLNELFGHYFVEYINSMFAVNNVADKCQQLSLNKVLSLEGVEQLNETHLYEMEFEVVPGGGIFRASALYDPRDNILKRQGSLQRVNRYGSDGNCVADKETMRPYCYCNGLRPKGGEERYWLFILAGAFVLLLLIAHRCRYHCRSLIYHYPRKQYTLLTDQKSSLI